MNEAEKPKSSWRERRQSIKHKWLAPFIFPEWLCERVSYLLGRWAFLDILGHVGRLTILIAVIFYFMEADERRMASENQRKAKHYQAWQVINAAQGKTSSGGRMDALQDLNSDGISLVGVDISKSYLPELNLENADLAGANLAEAQLNYASFVEADIRDANLAEAQLNSANLTRAFIVNANLAEAVLSNANLSEVLLNSANLTGVRLINANLAGASLGRANLAGADLRYANLAGADLKESNLKDIKGWRKIKSIEIANIYDVNNPPEGFIEWAIEQGAVSIEDDEEWKKLLSEKRQEKTKEK